jgi:O-antigen/teichoic acid export membrane protein
VSVYRKLIRHTSTYAVATVARRFASFFMLPVYTRYFTTSDYGVLELLDLAGTIIFYLIGARLSDGLLYFYAQAETEEEKLRVTHSALLTSHVCGLTGAIVGYLAAPWASIFMFGTDHYTYYMQLVFLTFAFTLPSEVGFGHLRAQNRSALTATLSIIRLLLAIVTNVVMLVWFHMGVASVLYSSLISAVVTCVYMDVTILRGALRFDWAVVWRVCRYSAPLAISAVGITIIHSGDRFFLQRYAGPAAVGLYSLAYKFGMLVGYIQVPFEAYWDAQVFHVIRGPDGENHFVRTLTYYSLALFGGALFVSLAAAPVIRLATQPDYYQAAVLVPVVAFAYAIRSPGDFFRGVFAICKQPFRNVTVTAAGVAITLTAYATLIPRYRVWGAAVATAITFLGMTAVSFWQSRKARIFHFEWRRLLQIALSGVSITTLALLYRPSTVVGQLAVSLAGLAAFPAALYITGFFQASELATMRHYAHAALQQARMWRERAIAAK